MPSIKYIVQRMAKMDFSAMRESAARVSARSSKSKAAVMLDMIICGVRYQAGYKDYDVFEMENTNAAQRKTYVTRGINNMLVNRFNRAEYCHFFFNKDEFNEKFSDLLGRRWIKIEQGAEEKFETFVDGLDEIIAKPRDGMCGKGIELIKPSDYSGAGELFAYLLSSDCDIAEEVVTQHPALSALYPGSINTVRAVTIVKDGKARLMCAYLRIGNGKRVDNFNSGGMMTRLNIDDGVAMFDACDKAGRLYDVHPLTGTKINGFQIPLWEECRALALRAAERVPEVGYVGWDIAVSDKGPLIIEGNEFPGHDIYQMPAHTPDKIGMLPLFESVL